MNDQFSDNAKDYKTYTNLTKQECAALDTLGELLPELMLFPTNLDPAAKLSERFKEVCGKSRAMANHATGVVKISASLYTTGEEDGYERVPCLTYTYTAVLPDRFDTAAEPDLHVVFIPAYLANISSSAKDADFVPQIIKAPEDINTILDKDARNVLRYIQIYQEASSALKSAASGYPKTLCSRILKNGKPNF